MRQIGVTDEASEASRGSTTRLLEEEEEEERMLGALLIVAIETAPLFPTALQQPGASSLYYLLLHSRAHAIPNPIGDKLGWCLLFRSTDRAPRGRVSAGHRRCVGASQKVDSDMEARDRYRSGAGFLYLPLFARSAVCDLEVSVTDGDP